jgi:hypothetical protein
VAAEHRGVFSSIPAVASCLIFVTFPAPQLSGKEEINRSATHDFLKILAKFVTETSLIGLHRTNHLNPGISDLCPAFHG